MTDHVEEMLLARRVPAHEVMVGRAYLVHSRSGPVGVACKESRNFKAHLAYTLHRKKFHSDLLYTEFDWGGDYFPTVIPLRLIREHPPEEPDELLDWLMEKGLAVRDEYNELLSEVWKVAREMRAREEAVR